MELFVAGRRFFVTGITRGVGRAIAQCLRAEGAIVHGCARDRSEIDAYRAALPREEKRLSRLFAIDVRDEAGMSDAVAAAGDDGGIDGVVAGAGAGTTGAALETPNDVWRQQLELKVLSVLNLVRPATRYLERSDIGRVVVINGVTAHHPDISQAAVSAARAAVANLGRALAEELAGRASLVVVNLGAIATDAQRMRFERLGGALSFEEWSSRQAAEREILAGRMGRPDEVGDLVTFLLSPRASYITGTAIDIAGGSHGRP